MTAGISGIDRRTPVSSCVQCFSQLMSNVQCKSLRRITTGYARKVGFKPRIVKEADGAVSALAFVAAGFGVAVVSAPLKKDTRQGCGFPQSGARSQSADACGRRLEAG